MRTCSITYFKDKNSKNPIEFYCSEYSVDVIANYLEQQGAKIDKIIVHERLKTHRKTLTIDEIEKRKYYNSKYSLYHRKYKKGYLSKETYDDIMEHLKVYKEVYKTKKELEAKFEEYKKTLTIIPTYNVSE